MHAPGTDPVDAPGAGPMHAPGADPVDVPGTAPLNAALLLLADSRLPAGGHGHSGGAEQAVTDGTVRDLPTLEAFLRGRLATAGLTAACLAAAACAHALAAAPPAVPDRMSPGCTAPDHTTGTRDRISPPDAPGPLDWAGLEAEADARTASPAQREASRVQGRLLLRTARTIWPSPALDALASATAPDGPHHPVALGAVAAAAGCTPGQAALVAAYASLTGPATAAVRLLGLDPVAVHRLLACLAPALETLSATAARPAAWEALPARAAPALDLLAERHARAGLRLFAS
ncbi:urease accessory protein UreF [Planomonospora corallina]|uniref:Urease accessory protein UreF n=1 Tax=Planomonospora corallina TaxID=1806052 RepID=A0ABV8I5I8_9ACTN